MVYSVARASNLRRISLYSSLFVVALIFVSLLPRTSFAADTVVNATLCGGETGSTITIATPQNDSVVTSVPIHLAGSVSNATQVDISVDGQYDSTLPLSTNATNYATDVSITTGTHTISLIANDICSSQNGSAEVVITYQPPSTGGGNSGGGGTSQPGPSGGIQLGTIDGSSTQDNVSGAPSSPFVGVVKRFLSALDFDVTGGRDGAWKAMLRFSFVVLGFGLVTLASLAVNWLGKRGKRVLGAISNVPADQVHEHRRSKWFLRLLGVILLIIAFTI